jgi:ATP-dependent DNA helicase RecG
VLPFQLTGAQKRSIEQAAGDMLKNTPMNRLVQGDVGSGKTAVAAACCWYTWKSGCQSAFMAPTEILAEQHFRTLSQLLEPLSIHVGLLTGSMTPKQKKMVQSQLRLGEIDVVIGTHALLSEGVEFFDLALVIADEQHRFGVSQRSALTAKGDAPHVLVMSATPIPRTLALIIYGDLDVSIIDELPPGRQKVSTYTANEKLRERTYNFMRKLVGERRQVYIVCPMVEESETADEDLKSAQVYAEKLQKQIFPDLKIALVHGRMKPKEKESVMAAFAAGATDILVATTVIEVGVDVPNAALMVVENADRFGLSQLHQLRGRVGRGQHQSYCILFEGTGGDISRERLKIMCDTNDGFKISEEDLKLRGPGDFFGSRQHGLPEMRIANLAADMDVLTKAQTAALEVLSRDPDLSNLENRLLKDRINELFELKANMLN